MGKQKYFSKIVASELFGLSEKRGDELIKEFKHCKIDSENVKELAKKLGLKKTGEDGFKSFVFGQFIKINNEIGRGFEDG